MMSHREIEPNQDAAVTPELERVVAELRTPVPVRPEWRAGVLHGIATRASPHDGPPDGGAVRRWALRPWTAIAAGIACAMAGAALMTVLLGRARPTAAGDVLGNLT